MFITDKQSTGRISRVVEITPLSPKSKINKYKINNNNKTNTKHEHESNV